MHTGTISKKRKRKLIDVTTSYDKKSNHSNKRAKMTAHHAAFKEIFQNEEIKRLQEENEWLKKAQKPQNRQVHMSKCLLIFSSFHIFTVYVILDYFNF